MKPKFCIGTIKQPTNSDSHAWRGKWSVNCVNMWVATLGKRLNLKNAILGHSIIMIHEITHALSGESYCWSHINGKIVYWDETIERILKEVLDMNDVIVWETN